MGILVEEKLIKEFYAALSLSNQDLLAEIVDQLMNKNIPQEEVYKELCDYNIDYQPDFQEDEEGGPDYSRKFIDICKTFLIEIGDIRSIEKIFTYEEGKGRKFAILLNEDPNNFGAIKNRKFYFDSEKDRDKEWGRLKRKLELFGILFK